MEISTNNAIFIYWVHHRQFQNKFSVTTVVRYEVPVDKEQAQKKEVEKEK
jgi:hypothetical protein